MAPNELLCRQTSTPEDSVLDQSKHMPTLLHTLNGMNLKSGI